MRPVIGIRHGNTKNNKAIIPYDVILKIAAWRYSILQSGGLIKDEKSFAI